MELKEGDVVEVNLKIEREYIDSGSGKKYWVSSPASNDLETIYLEDKDIIRKIN